MQYQLTTKYAVRASAILMVMLAATQFVFHTALAKPSQKQPSAKYSKNPKDKALTLFATAEASPVGSLDVQFPDTTVQLNASADTNTSQQNQTQNPGQTDAQTPPAVQTPGTDSSAQGTETPPSEQPSGNNAAVQPTVSDNTQHNTPPETQNSAGQQTLLQLPEEFNVSTPQPDSIQTAPQQTSNAETPAPAVKTPVRKTTKPKNTTTSTGQQDLAFNFPLKNSLPSMESIKSQLNEAAAGSFFNLTHTPLPSPYTYDKLDPKTARLLYEGACLLIVAGATLLLAKPMRANPAYIRAKARSRLLMYIQKKSA